MLRPLVACNGRSGAGGSGSLTRGQQMGAPQPFSQQRADCGQLAPLWPWPPGARPSLLFQDELAAGRVAIDEMPAFLHGQASSTSASTTPRSTSAQLSPSTKRGLEVGGRALVGKVPT